jgi:hypothetical protein
MSSQGWLGNKEWGSSDPTSWLLVQSNYQGWTQAWPQGSGHIKENGIQTMWTHGSYRIIKGDSGAQTRATVCVARALGMPLAIMWKYRCYKHVTGTGPGEVRSQTPTEIVFESYCWAGAWASTSRHRSGTMATRSVLPDDRMAKPTKQAMSKAFSSALFIVHRGPATTDPEGVALFSN